MLREALEEFKKKTPKSQEMYHRALQVMPGGVSHNLRTWKLPSVGAYPIHIKAAEGSHIWDVDDNEYVDNWMGHMTAILGHNPKPIVTALENQLTMVGGTHWGIVNEKQVELAELVCKLVPSVEMVRFCSSGNEATMYAVRLARGYTGKKLVIKAFGGWHGYNPLLNWYHLKPFDEIKESKGQIVEFSEYVRGVQFGNMENILDMIRRNKEDLACVILEISMTKNREQDHEKITEYLKRIKDELKKFNALLILDEVVTGFRLAQGGAQEYFGVNADLTTFGKIVGGGMPVGVVGGREEILHLANVVDWQAGRKKKSDLVWIGGGTFSGNIMTMIAGIETLKVLKKNKSIYDNLEQTGREIRSGFRKIFNEANLPFEVLGIQSAFKSDLDTLSRNAQMEWIIRLLNKGIFGHRPEGYLSSVHSSEDVKKNVQVVGSIVEEMTDEIKDIE